jgi:transposase-like protein
MLIRLHKKATTTPAIREYIRTSPKGVKALARELNLNPGTVRKWRGREDTQDASRRPHKMQTTLSPAQEALVVELRRTVLLSLDDLVAVTRAHIHPDASRAAIGRLLAREGVSRLADLMPAEEGGAKPKKTFKDYAPGYLHIDLKELPRMPDEADKSYLCVAIDRASRWVYFEILPDKTAQGTKGFLERLAAACPFKIEKILTDNGKEFTDRFTAQGEREPTGRHPFDRGCAALGAEHRLIPPYRPQTNGMVERFNGRVADILKATRFRTAAELSTALGHYLRLYNGQIPQRALGHVPPLQALKAWREKEPERFVREIHNLPGLDIYSGFILKLLLEKKKFQSKNNGLEVVIRNFS